MYEGVPLCTRVELACYDINCVLIIMHVHVVPDIQCAAENQPFGVKRCRTNQNDARDPLFRLSGRGPISIMRLWRYRVPNSIQIFHIICACTVSYGCNVVITKL